MLDFVRKNYGTKVILRSSCAILFLRLGNMVPILQLREKKTVALDKGNVGPGTEVATF